jgi:hypothetical protein
MAASRIAVLSLGVMGGLMAGQLAKTELPSGKTIIEHAGELELFQPSDARNLLEPQSLPKPFPNNKDKSELR